MKFLKPITISLSPNTEKDDVFLSFLILFMPWMWKSGKAIRELENKFKEFLGVKYAFSFNSGRSSLLVLLKALGLEKGSEVLLQAFTCNAAANPVIWAGLKPVYVDCNEESFNVDFDDLERKITPRSKALIVQHTFGLPAEMDKITEFCQKRNLVLIEDCAHSLGAQFSGKKTGTFGRAAFFSFSRDKIISSVYGGMLTTNDSDLALKIDKIYKSIKFPSFFWIKQQLLHPVLFNWLILPTYKLFGKYLLVIFQKINLLSKAVHSKEKVGKMPGYFPKRLPNSLAVLALKQFGKMDRFNEHRKTIAKIYRDSLKDFEVPLDFQQVYLRFTVKHPKAHSIIRYFWRKNILIGDWYTSPLAPKDTKADKIFYIPGSCPKAERLAQTTFNLPTHINITKEDAEKIVGLLKSYGNKGN
ncbi:MAG: aminotransferase class I/II-fold pyridoxal phosphate-dependent enzyme [Candidatus Paceibacterota bacterium]|jgi:dTDP-4-amino-4,6-dideoxygalactose transaminase